jgi:NAD(P)-dependent dehydrogenase (short-subunit alcohol dehydrogenase family)
MHGDLNGRRVAVVGATGGIGSAVVKELARRGALVVAVGRSDERLSLLPCERVFPLALDIGRSDAGILLEGAVARELGGLDALINATGAIGPIGPTRSIDPLGMLENFRLGPVAALRLIQACASLLDESPAPSVVVFSGGGATDVFPRYSAYALEKTAMVRLVENLAAEESAWKVNAVAPGFVATGIHEATLQAGAELVGDSYFAETQERLGGKAVPPTHAAEVCAFLVSEESAGISGRLISAVWDPWRGAAPDSPLRTSASFGRLRRIDGQWFEDVNP